MIKTVLFVHGTGVRKAAYEATAALVAEGLKRCAPQVRLEPCLWGDALGARLTQGGRSIPEFIGETPKTVTDEQQLALWRLLGIDPLFELRELAAAAPAGGLEPPTEKQRKQAFLARLRGLGADASLHTLLAGAALPGQWQQVVDAVAGDDALQAALATAARVDTPLRVATAHALAALLQRQLADDQMPGLGSARRDALVDACVDLLGGRELGVKDWITSRLVGFGKRWATAKARREREALYSAAYPAAGDILLYQARGQAIRDFIAARAAACGDGVALLAHSLGGIACVDLLVERALPNVELLVTAGSQAPFLYEIGALSQLPAGQPLPPHFPKRWLNAYDLNDLLSYSAERIFAGVARDLRIDSGEPFPDSHSAYWTQQPLWDALGPALKA